MGSVVRRNLPPNLPARRDGKTRCVISRPASGGKLSLVSLELWRGRSARLPSTSLRTGRRILFTSWRISRGAFLAQPFLQKGLGENGSHYFKNIGARKSFASTVEMVAGSLLAFSFAENESGLGVPVRFAKASARRAWHTFSKRQANNASPKAMPAARGNRFRLR